MAIEDPNKKALDIAASERTRIVAYIREQAARLEAQREPLYITIALEVLARNLEEKIHWREDGVARQLRLVAADQD